MKHYFFKDPLEIEPVNKLLEFITSTEDKIIIYFDTTGGDNSVTEYLTTFLETVKDRVVLFAGNVISSNGFWLFYNFTGIKTLSTSTYSVVHNSWMSFRSYSIKDKKSSDYITYQQMKAFNNNKLEILKLFLTDKEIKVLKREEDVVLDSKRLKEIFKINE